MHTHHSHSGQFCQHAKNQLEEMIMQAIELKFELMCLSEHMPRISSVHLYPEELETQTTIADLEQTFSQYIQEARRLRAKYADRIEILIGFEAEGIDDAYLDKVESLVKEYNVDFFIGSLHHSGDIPIDYSPEAWADLVSKEPVPSLMLKYFKRLQIVLRRLKPAVIGHYDLIRLFAERTPVVDSETWAIIQETVDEAIANDCMFELNSSAIRKGWSTPYPQRDIASYIAQKGGKFCLSDDSHNTTQIGLNYGKVIQYVESLGVEEVWRLKKTATGVEKVSVPLKRVSQWNASI